MIHLPDAPDRRRPLVGYAMVWTAALLFALNGTVSKVVLESGISTIELTQVRSLGACVGFALLIQYLAPLLVALWARYARHEDVRRRIWVALALALAGLALVVQPWGESLALDGLGVAAALAAAVAYAVYILLAERGVRRRDPFSLTLYGFLFAGLFWAAFQPLWLFPAAHVGGRTSLLGNLDAYSAPVWLLLAFVVAVGTMLTFGLVVSALRHVSATRVGIVAMLEPVVATLIAYLWLAEALGPLQLAGGGVVLAGILLAQTAR